MVEEAEEEKGELAEEEELVLAPVSNFGHRRRIVSPEL